MSPLPSRQATPRQQLEKGPSESPFIPREECRRAKPADTHALLTRLLDQPNLVAAVQALPARALVKLIDHVGLKRTVGFTPPSPPESHGRLSAS